MAPRADEARPCADGTVPASPFRDRALRPFLTASGTQADYDTVGRAVGLGGGAFKVAQHRLRERFREALGEEVRETQPDDGGVDAEMAYLLRVLAG